MGALVCRWMQLHLARSSPGASAFPEWEVRLGSNTGHCCWANEILSQTKRWVLLQRQKIH